MMAAACCNHNIILLCDKALIFIDIIDTAQTSMSITDPLMNSQHSDHSDTKMVHADMTSTEGFLSAKMFQNGKECFLSLKDSRLIIETQKSKVTTIINFRDILGVIPCLKKNKNAETDFYFEVHSFGIQTGGCGCCGGSSKGERKERVDEFQCQDVTSYWNWQHAINCSIRLLPIMKGEGELLLPPARRRMLVQRSQTQTQTDTLIPYQYSHYILFFFCCAQTLLLKHVLIVYVY